MIVIPLGRYTITCKKSFPHRRFRLWGALLLAAFLATWQLLLPLSTLGAAQVPALVSIEPSSQSVAPGQSFTCNVEVSGVENMGAFEFKLRFAPDVLEAEGVSLGGFLASTGRQVAAVGPKIDNKAGTISLGEYSLGDKAGPDGSGVLAVVAFKALKGGRSPLDLVSVIVADVDGNTLLATPKGGVVDVIEGAPTVTAPAASPTAAATLPRLPTVTASPTATETSEPTATATPTVTRPVERTSTATPLPSVAPTSTATIIPKLSSTTAHVESTPVSTLEVVPEAVATVTSSPGRTPVATEGPKVAVLPTEGQGMGGKVPTPSLPPTAPAPQPPPSDGLRWKVLGGVFAVVVVVAALGALYIRKKS